MQDPAGADARVNKENVAVLMPILEYLKDHVALMGDAQKLNTVFPRQMKDRVDEKSAHNASIDMVVEMAQMQPHELGARKRELEEHIAVLERLIGQWLGNEAEDAYGLVYTEWDLRVVVGLMGMVKRLQNRSKREVTHFLEALEHDEPGALVMCMELSRRGLFKNHMIPEAAFLPNLPAETAAQVRRRSSS